MWAHASLLALTLVTEAGDATITVLVDCEDDPRARELATATMQALSDRGWLAREVIGPACGLTDRTEAAQALGRASAAFERVELAAARAELVAAEALLRAGRPLSFDPELFAEVLLLLAWVSHELDDTGGATAALQRLAAVSPGHVVPADRFPPNIVDLFAEQAAQVRRQPDLLTNLAQGRPTPVELGGATDARRLRLGLSESGSLVASLSCDAKGNVPTLAGVPAEVGRSLADYVARSCGDPAPKVSWLQQPALWVGVGATAVAVLGGWLLANELRDRRDVRFVVLTPGSARAQ